MSATIKPENPRWWGAAHVLATIGHLVMGIVGTVTFHNTTIQAFEDFLSGSSLGSPSIRQMGEASLLQGATAVGWVGFVFNLTYFASLLWADHKVSCDSISRSWAFRRKLTVLVGVLLACGLFIADITLASVLGVKGPRVVAGAIAASSIAGFLMALTIAADLVRLHLLDVEQEKPLGGTEKSQQQA